MQAWFATASGRARARAEGVLRSIEKRGTALQALSDERLQELAVALREQARGGARPDRLLVETYALVREAAARTVGMRPFDVQVLGAVLLHGRRVAEMKTGEGKTLAATMPVVLEALAGRGVHVVTVNDYLAARDAAWMGPVYRFMGLEVGVVTEDIDPDEQREERKRAYAADITYVTNHELVFDFLRDNLALAPDEVVIRPLHCAVVDEVDLLLLDEARTPLIISGPTGDDPGICQRARAIARRLQAGTHYRVDHKARQVLVQEAGWTAIERALGVSNLADPEHLEWQHAMYNAMLAHAVYERDVDYIVDDDHVYLVDEFTGRVSEDKRFADGLHQALEAKEQVTVRSEDRTLAKTSYQMFFSMYPRLCGMTGTAYSVREELQRTYGLQVVRVPTHRRVIRRDLAPVAYRTAGEKFEAVAAEIERLQRAGRPVLVGTTSVRESEQLASLLQQRDVSHAVLNAKNHRAEAAVIAQAGRPGAVTISTNMAGRGVDILLGGNPDEAGEDDPVAAERIRARCAADRERVVAAGGLAVVGTGLHESRRIDDQLRGRAGRQGDPGTSRYFLSLDDPVYKRFGEIDPGSRILERLRRRLRSHPRDEPVRDAGVLATMEDLRRKVEVENEATRKEVLKYDVVIEEHRRTVYDWRRKLVYADAASTGSEVDGLADEIADDLRYRVFAGVDRVERDSYELLAREAEVRFGVEIDPDGPGKDEAWTPESAVDAVVAGVRDRMAEQRAALGDELFDEAGRQILLAVIDELWTEHLTTLERVDEGIGLRAYGQLDPLVEFRREANLLYHDMMREIRLQAVSGLCGLEVEQADTDGDRAPSHASDRPVRRALKR